MACEGIEQRLDMLLRLVRGKEFIILVIGEKGSGKTTLMLRLLENTGLMHRRIVIRAFHKTPSPKSEELTNLHNRPAWILQDQHTPIILIDDAHELSRNELLYLLQNTINPNNPETAKRLVLFGEPSLKKMLSEIGDAPEGKIPVNTVYLPALTLEEARQYIEDRMRSAGMKGKLPFSRAQVKKIYRSTAGLPAKINQHAHSWLQTRYARPSLVKRLLAQPRSFFLLTAVIILTVVAVFFGLKRYDNDNQVRKQPASLPVRQAERPENKLPVHTDAPRSEQQASPPGTIASNSDRASDPLHGDESTQIPSAAVATAKPVETQTATSTDPRRSDSEPQKPTQSTEQQPRQSKAPPQNQLAVHREDWLLSQNPEHYTIQILGVKKESALWWFVQNTSLPKGYELAYYETSNDGTSWYPLVFGIFTDRESASEVMKKMPRKVRDRSPWIRSLASVQAAIHSRR